MALIALGVHAFVPDLVLPKAMGSRRRASDLARALGVDAWRTGAWCWLIALTLVQPAYGGARSIRYLLDLREPDTHLVQVTMIVPEASAATEIQFPAWNNLYQILDFVRNVQELRANCEGQPLELARVDLNTWRTPPDPCPNLEVRYAVYAHTEGPFSSALNTEHAFLNFATLLFYLPQERGREARVKILLPRGWRIATLLEGDAPRAASEEETEYQAPDYDVLVDSPVEAGHFQEYSYTQELHNLGSGPTASERRPSDGRATYRVIVHADPQDYSAERLLASLQKITATETSLMRDLPFARYTFIFHFPREGGGGMEHRNGTAISVPTTEVRAHWESVEAVAAHEFFHLWNVKRIRPQALEPIDYVHGSDTRDLWFSEGVTSTYAELSLLRAGLLSPNAFCERVAEAIQILQGRPARQFQSAELSGREAWLEKYADYHRPERSISYYNKGELLGFLLDLGIRHASRNQASLDGVMRRLNEDFARRGRFFTQADLRDIILQLAPSFSGLNAFFHDAVEGTRELDYDTYLGYAGLHLVQGARELPTSGFVAVRNSEGFIQVESFEPGSRAQIAGLERGDVLVKMNGQTLTELPDSYLSRYKPGHKVKFEVRRQAQTTEIEYTLGVRQQATYRVEEVTSPTREQLQVREGWLKGVTMRAQTAGNP